ncbi:chemotaxis protein methyltransferase Cher2 [bacterium BMS3Abin04]|nr:chemotaxis protein methyltransferase Cher2 [bacterium BMS3Abin04]
MMQQTLAPKPTNSFKFNFSSNNNRKLQMTDRSYDEWRKYIYEISGIYFQDNKKYLLESRLQKRINYLGIDSFEKYLEYLRFNPKRELEKKQLFEVITINETYFFRNQPQFDALISTIIPEILASDKKANKNKLRIWSAASSTGEEAYTIAMMVSELIKPKYPNLNVEIVGTDINFAVIETAKRGIYKEYSIRNTPPLYLKKYFKQNNNSYEISPELKKMTSFKLVNLYSDTEMRMMTSFDVIFCANVLIYFDSGSKKQVVSNLYNSLNREGYLFIGYSESLHGISKAFKLTSFPKTIGYKKE